MVLSKSKLITIAKILTVSLLLFWYIFWLFKPINLPTVDLGRHLKNGEVFLSALSSGDTTLLNNLWRTNLYSYTHSDFPFINHHWGSGVIFFLIYSLVGFTGLHLFYILLSLFIFSIFYYLAVSKAGFRIASIVSLLIIPLLATRLEIRPEIFSYFFIGLFIFILDCYQSNKLSTRWLITLPLLGILWANLHIYFFFGLAVILLWLFYNLITRSSKIKVLTFTAIATLLSFFVTPFGLRAVMYPYLIFQNYGYRIVENQSVWFLNNLGISTPHLILFQIVFWLFIISLALSIYTKRQLLLSPLPVMTFLVAILAWLAIRNFALFALLALPTISLSLATFLNRWRFNYRWLTLSLLIVGILILEIIFILYSNIYPFQTNSRSLGIKPQNIIASEFIQTVGLPTPIFNNYDIGSFLIFNLYPQQSVFVDNRPEAYPSSWLTNTYIPIQEDNELWLEWSAINKPQTIIFYRHDLTPWGQQFLINRTSDSTWKPVYLDNSLLIFVKDTPINKTLIDHYWLRDLVFNIPTS